MKKQLQLLTEFEKTMKSRGDSISFPLHLLNFLSPAYCCVLMAIVYLTIKQAKENDEKLDRDGTYPLNLSDICSATNMSKGVIARTLSELEKIEIISRENSKVGKKGFCRIKINRTELEKLLTKKIKYSRTV